MLLDSSVVQGSVLGPLIFLAYINTRTGYNWKLFADNVKLYTTVTSVNSYIELQYCLDRLTEWSKLLQMKISHHKCLFFKFERGFIDDDLSLEDRELPYREQIRDVGLTLDKSLKPSRHTHDITSKARCCVGITLKPFV